jgi:hypothetical protein
MIRDFFDFLNFSAKFAWKTIMAIQQIPETPRTSPNIAARAKRWQNVDIRPHRGAKRTRPSRTCVAQLPHPRKLFTLQF